MLSQRRRIERALQLTDKEWETIEGREVISEIDLIMDLNHWIEALSKKDKKIFTHGNNKELLGLRERFTAWQNEMA